MRIVRFSADGNIKYGLLDCEKIGAIKGFPWDGLDMTGEDYDLQSVRLLAPVEPPDIFAIGLNYREHADESGMKRPSEPVVFLKASSSVIGPDDDIKLPKMAPAEVDYEAELAIVIGRTCRNVSEADALDYALGYACGNDVSARDCQRKFDVQWARAKSFDTFCPLGPWITTDIDPDNQPISLRLNGQIMQSSNTNDTIFNCRKLISYCSQIATMKPGTVILTGTPPGVGFARKEPVFLKEGDVVEVVIGEIGTLKNSVVRES